MAKTKKNYFECQDCGHQSVKWNGKCLNCGSWDSYMEVKPSSEVSSKMSSTHLSQESQVAIPIDAVPSREVQRIKTDGLELDRVLGGGIVPGSLILLGGHPGIGKSTLLLQTALDLAVSVLYVSGEESNYQIKLRAERLRANPSHMLLMNATNIHEILDQVEKIKPVLLIIDSIQTCFHPESESLPGTVSQIKTCTQLLQQYAKQKSVSIILVGHINKEGNIAGPMILEHIVDTVLIFEGERQYHFRILRAIKNRFGSTDEIGLFDMKEQGLIPISNPSELFLSSGKRSVTGQTVAAIMEGRRTVLCEVQVLLSQAIYGTPQRSTTGFDTKRLHMILAVIENKLGIFLGQKDVYLNIAGGLNIKDPAVDMAIVAAILSSHYEVILSAAHCFIGELSLSGDFSSVAQADARISEAQRLGFNNVLSASIHSSKENAPANFISIESVHNLEYYIKNAS